MYKKWIALLLVVGFMLSACRSEVYNQTQANVADVKLKMADERHRSDAIAKPKPSLLVKQGLYVDTTPVNLEREPSWLRYRIVIRGDQLPFSYYSRTIATGAGNGVLTRFQQGLDPSVKVSMNHSGTIKGALNMLATKAGYVYNVRKNSINWQAFVTKTFDIAFMPGSSDYLMGKSSGGAGTTGAGSTSATGGGGQNFVSSDYSDAEYSNLSGKLSIWKDLDVTIKQILSPQGKVMVSESTTSVTVRDRPSNVELVDQYIRNLNNNLSKQVLVKIQLLEVQLEDGYNQGINWGLIVRAFHKSPFRLDANFGTPVTITHLIDQPSLKLANGSTVSGPLIGTVGDGSTPSYTVLLNALNQQGKTSIVSEPRVVCLNNQVSVVRIVNQESYVASIQNTALPSTVNGNSSSTTVNSQVTPGSVITGITLYILPKILKDNVYLQVNADLSTLVKLRDFGGIQLPEISLKHFNQRSMILSGDTMILSGFRQLSNTANAMQLFKSQTLGGKGALQKNTETIVLITPIILHGYV